MCPGLHLGQYDALQAALAEIDGEVERDLDPFRDAVRLLGTIPGIGDLAARAVVAEIGTDMGRFPTAGHLVSWAGLCPRNDESAGKRRSTRLRQGAPWLKTTLVQCAWAASRKKDGYLRAQFQRLRARGGPKKAICAVAASILTAAYHTLSVQIQAAIIAAVRCFDDFSVANDPHGEHDFGLVEVAGHRVLFKIDYYNPSLCGHSADPADPMVTLRVLTIMLADAY